MGCLVNGTPAGGLTLFLLVFTSWVLCINVFFYLNLTTLVGLALQLHNLVDEDVRPCRIVLAVQLLVLPLPLHFLELMPKLVYLLFRCVSSPIQWGVQIFGIQFLRKWLSIIGIVMTVGWLFKSNVVFWGVGNLGDIISGYYCSLKHALIPINYKVCLNASHLIFIGF